MIWKGKGYNLAEFVEDEQPDLTEKILFSHSDDPKFYQWLEEQNPYPIESKKQQTMNQPILLEYDEQTGCLSAECGKVIVCYIESLEEIRLIRTEDKKEVKSEYFQFSLTGFIEKIKHYTKIANCK